LLGDCSALVTNAAHATAIHIAYKVRYGEYLRAKPDIIAS
jgi:hypothetical protein